MPGESMGKPTLAATRRVGLTYLRADRLVPSTDQENGEMQNKLFPRQV